MSNEPDDDQTPPQEPGDAAGREPICEIPTHDRELARLEQEREQLEEQLKRALADTANIRRRQQKELDDARRRALEGLAQELLPVLDNFALALQAHDEQQQPDDVGPLVDGVRMVRTLLTAALERHGMQEIPALGVAFDPNRHEAIGLEPRSDVPAGQIVKVLQPGYQLGDRVIRPSRVLVAGAEPGPAT